MSSSKGIEKIDLCNNCYNKKAEYLFYSIGGIFFYHGRIRLLCKDCAKQQAESANLGLVK